MKKVKIVLILILAFILITSANVIESYAEEPATGETTVDPITLDEINKKANAFGAYKDKAKIEKKQAEDNLEPVGQILVWFANIVSVVSVVIMGIRWITASPEQLAKIKGQSIGLAISIAVIYAAMGIWNMLIKVLDK